MTEKKVACNPAKKRRIDEIISEIKEIIADCEKPIAYDLLLKSSSYLLTPSRSQQHRQEDD